MRIFYLPNDMDGPGFYRCLSPAKQLAEQGGHQVQLPRIKDNGVYAVKQGLARFELQLSPVPVIADAYVIQQPKIEMWATGGIQKLQALGVPVVIDVDDNYAELDTDNPAYVGTHPYYSKNYGRIMERPERRRIARALRMDKLPMNPINREYLHTSCRQADLLTVSTPYLAEVYSRFNKNVKVVRNYVDWSIWDDITPQYEVERPRLRVGYLGTYKFHHADLDVLKPWFPDWIKAHPEIDFVTTDKETHDFLEVPENQRVTIGTYGFFPAKPGDDYPVGEKTAVCDIGLVPLRMTPFNEGKSHLKGMEYNAAGIPFIASPTESYRYWCVEGANGGLARVERDWAAWLDYYVENDDRRRWMGKMGREEAERHSIQHHWQKWEKVLAPVSGGKDKVLARESIRVGAVQKVSELSKFLAVVERIKPQTIVEIGTANGGTLYGMMKVATDDALAVSIDIPGGSVNDVDDEGEDVYRRRPDYRERIKTFCRDGQLIKLIDESSQEGATKLKLRELIRPRKKIDVLFLDGDHTYEGVSRDFELYAPLVRSGGIIAFHDIVDHSRETVGVHILWDELKGMYWKCEEIIFTGEDWGTGDAWGGIGVLYV